MRALVMIVAVSVVFSLASFPASADHISLFLDTDGDGYNDVAESGAPLCGAGLDELAENDDRFFDDNVVNDGCPAVGAPETNCDDNNDDDEDGHTNDGCPQVGDFSEGEFNIGTDALSRCGEGAEAGPSPSWPSDLVSAGFPDSTDRITIADLVSFLAPVRRLDTVPPDPEYDSRWDLSPGPAFGPDWIWVGDLTMLVAGSTGFPPMFDGERAFSGPACTEH